MNTHLHGNKKHREYYLALASLTHELTGEDVAEILTYLEKFGVTGFFARVDASELSDSAKLQLNDLHQYLRNFDEVFAHGHV
ncbi:MAG: hypothetical protein EOM03_18440 [Clostridia bacterium]|nr:hypothetical protein [Clostridia bacterium]